MFWGDAADRIETSMQTIAGRGDDAVVSEYRGIYRPKYVENAKTLIGYGASLNVDQQELGEEQGTPFQIAVEYNNIPLIEYLLGIDAHQLPGQLPED
jgi:hypothetical protein